MTPKLQSWIAGALAIITGLAGLDLAGFIQLLPQKWATALVSALPLLAAIVHIAKALQDDLDDDGLLNGSTRGTKPPGPLKIILLPFLVLACMAISSCSGIVSGLTGVPPEPVAVKRDGGTPVNVVKRDLILAETGPPATVYGLYDIGQVARLTGKVVDTGK